MSKLSKAELDALVGEAIVDCYDREEQAAGLYSMIQDNLATPFQTQVLGLDVVVKDVDLRDDAGHLHPRRVPPGRPDPRPPAPGAASRGRGVDRRLPSLAGLISVSRKPPVLPPKLQAWEDARRRHRLSHAQVQMARELGLNPRKLGKLDNHGQEPWKQPLPQFIEHLYGKRFGRDRPGVVTPIEEQARQLAQDRAGRKARRAVCAQTTKTRDHERVSVLRVPGDRPPAG